eukprot:PITA_22972
MPFGLINVGATFQRPMDIDFVGEKDKFAIIYLDDITFFSSNHKDHLQHLRKVFLKCRRFGISVNPRKSQFALEEGKLLRNIVSAAGVKIDLEIVQAIQTLSIPRSKGDIQSFLASVKDVLTQLDVDGIRAKWIAKLIEFDIEVKPIKLVKGQGLAKLMAKENCNLLDINCMSLNSYGEQTEEVAGKHEQNQCLAENLATCEWYSSIVHFLLKLEVPLGLSLSQARTIKLRSAKFCINKNLLYWRDPSGILLRYLDKEQSVEIMHHFHSSICGGHHHWKTTTHKILRAGYYWTALFSDVFSFVRSCDKFQRFTGRYQLKSLPLKPIHTNCPF